MIVNLQLLQINDCTVVLVARNT